MAKFSVRARAVDMLGRQQIAGIPTAIHELFKNAHDAYATRVEADFIRDGRLLVIRDNGLGMTREDFVNKWLALGTESKLGLNTNGQEVWTGPENLPLRAVLGEKGIGRLAIATIAPLTFALSRSVRQDGIKGIVASLVCWELFEVPGINISDIDIPVAVFEELPKLSDVLKMRDSILNNALDILPKNYVGAEAVLKRLTEYSLDPEALDQWFEEIKAEESKNLSLKNGGYGTHFYLSPTDDILMADVDEDDQTRDAPPLKRVLLGFGNAMQDGVEPPIKAEFRDHKISGVINELISGDVFFKSADLKKADHLFEGRFDEFGQFVGTLSIYKGNVEPYVLNWPGSNGKQTECGAFTIRLAAVQGRSSESLLDPESHKEIMDKLWRYGGFYVYRDGIRVLPYGQSDYDWLKIENRRTLAAKDWFFSHRRMIGYVAIDHVENSTLIEKAGREGFRENRAFRQFRAIIENWLKEIAKDYFRERSDHGGEFREKRSELQTKAELLIRRKLQVTARRREFKDAINGMLEYIGSGGPDNDLDAIMLFFRERLSSLGGIFPDHARIDSDALEAQFFIDVDKLEKKLTLSRPRLFSPSKEDGEAFENYLEWFDNFRAARLEPARRDVASNLASFRNENKIEVLKRTRAFSAIENEKNEALKQLRLVRVKAETELLKVDQEIKRTLKNGIDGFKNFTEQVLIDINKADLDSMSDTEAFSKQRELEIKMSRNFESQWTSIESVIKQLQSLGADVVDRVAPEETIAALESRIADLEDQLALYNDLAQAGGAVGIIGHEMENMVGGIRESLREIKPWADGTPGLDLAYKRLRLNFDHIDGYLSLFAPLSRRVRRSATDVSGKMILRYLNDAFSSRLKKAGIEVFATKAFEGCHYETYASTVLAAFVNVIDNAIYWICADRNSERWIKLDASPAGFTIENGGPGIPIRVATQIFNFGVSMKPDGRGMGLSVSYDALKTIGFKLELVGKGVDVNPKFQIFREQISFKDDGNE